MITDQRSLNRAINEKISSFTDRDVFLSEAYKHRLTQMSNGVLEKNHGKTDVIAGAKNITAYTDGKTRTINFMFDLIQVQPDREAMDKFMRGFNLHETAHCLLTDFCLHKKFMETMAREHRFLCPPFDNPYKSEAEKLVKKLNLLEVFNHLDNSIEDGFINRAVKTAAPGYYEDLLFVLDQFAEKEQFSYSKEQLKMPKPLLFANMILLYAVYNLKAYKPNEVSKDPLLKLFEEVIPWIDKAVVETDPEKRKRLIVTVFCYLIQAIIMDWEESKQNGKNSNNNSEQSSQRNQNSSEQSGSQNNASSSNSGDSSNGTSKANNSSAATNSGANEASSDGNGKPDTSQANNPNEKSNASDQQKNSANAAEQEAEDKNENDSSSEGTDCSGETQSERPSDGSNESNGTDHQDNTGSSDASSEHETNPGNESRNNENGHNSGDENERETEKSNGNDSFSAPKSEEDNSNAKSENGSSSDGEKNPSEQEGLSSENQHTPASQNDSNSSSTGNSQNSQKAAETPPAHELQQIADEVKDNMKSSEKADHSKANTSANKKAVNELKRVQQNPSLQNEECPSGANMDGFVKQLAADAVEQAQEAQIALDLNNNVKKVQYHPINRNIACEIRRPQRNAFSDAQYECERIQLDPIVRKMSREFLKELQDRQTGDTMIGLFNGKRLDVHHLQRDDKRIFSQKILPEDIPEMAVGILVDCSGSMSSNDRITIAKRCAYITYEFCKELKIPCFIFGHTADYGRVIMYSVADEHSLDKNESKRIFCLSHVSSNRDGYALRFCLEKLLKIPAEDRLMLIISDGKPSYYSSYQEAKADIQGTVHEFIQKGIHTVAAGIDDDASQVKEVYKDGRADKDSAEYLEISNLDRLPKAFVKIIKKRLS